MADTYKLSNLMGTTSGMTLVTSTILKSGKTQVIDKYHMYSKISYGRWYYSQAQTTFDNSITNVAVKYNGNILFTLENGSLGECDAFGVAGLTATEKIYEQSGTLDTGEKFNKICVYGTTINLSLASFQVDTIFEMFLIGKGEKSQIIFNFVKAPKPYLYRYEYALTGSSTDKNMTTKLPVKAAPSKIYLTYAGTADKWKVTTDLFSTVTLDKLLNTNWFLCGSYNNSVTVKNSSLFDFFKLNNQALSQIAGYGRGRIILQSSGNIICVWGTTNNGAYSSYYVEYMKNVAELTLEDGSRFFKMRGRMRVKSGSKTALIYEMYLLNNQKILIYIAGIPDDDTKATGENYVNLFGVNTSLGEVTAGEKIWLYLDDAGTSYAMKTGNDSEVSKIEILTPPTENTFYLGSKLNLDGLTVRVTFADGSTFDILKLNEINVSYTNELGNQTVTVAFRGKTATFQTECLEDKVASIDFTISADHYMIGENFGYIRVTATRLSGKTETVNASDYTVSGYDMNTQGIQTVTVSYGGIMATKDILVDSPDTATLTVEKNIDAPYLVNFDGFSANDLSATLTYSDGQTKTVLPTCSGYDNETAGEKVVTASYYGLSAICTVQVVEEITSQVDDITMALNGLTGKAVISGSGEIPSDSDMFSNPRDRYGYGYKKAVKTAEIAEGIISVCGFIYCSNLTSVQFPETLGKVEYEAFGYCTSLTETTLPENVATVNNYAFYSCTSVVLTIKNAECQIYDNSTTLQVAKLKGHIDSTAQSYAEKYNIEFEPLETVIKIQITKKPEKTYHIGDTLDKEDFEVTVTFDTGESKTTKSYEFEYDFSTAGEKNIKIIYGELSDSFTVNIVEYTFSELVNTTAGMQVTSNTRNDDNTDTVDGVEWFKFNNVTVDKLYINGNNWIGFGTSSQQLKICYRDGAVWNVYRQETMLDNGVRLLKIRVEGYTYYSGRGDHESRIKYELFLFDNNDMYLNVIQSPVSTSSYAGASSLICNSRTTTLSLNGATEDSPVQVTFLHQDDSGLDWDITYRAYKFATPVGIKIVTLPGKIKYKVNETFDSSGIVVAAVYDDGGTGEVGDFTVSSPDMTTPGTKSVTVTYSDFAATFDIEVIDISGIEVTTLPLKTEYRKDNVLDTTGLVISTVWTDGSKETLAEGYTVSNLDSTETGEKTVTVTYRTFLTTFTVTVVADTIGIRISNYPDRIYYRIGETLFDRTGMKIVKIRADETEKEVTDYNVLGFDSSKVGTCTVRISYTEIISSTESETFYIAYDVQITNDGENPFADDTAEIAVKVHWPNGEFKDLENKDIVTGSMSLKEGICEDQYFIFGGCLHNMITFDTHAEQFLSTEESSTPHGKIEVTIECNNTPVRLFTGEIDSGKRLSDLETRRIVAYDELYKYRNADISRWLKSKIGKTVPAKTWTQKEFRDNLFSYLGIKQDTAKLYYDNAYIPNTQADNEINAVDTLKDMCLQNKVFGWMDRYGEFRYLDIPANSYTKGHDKQNNELYEYYEAEIHVDIYEKFEFKEGRIWHPRAFYSTPDPYYWFGSGEPASAQEAYESNTYYNRNSFFVGDSDWLDYAWDVDEYGTTSLEKPKFEICYGPISKWDAENADRHLYRAQEYSLTLPGNPLNKPGQTIEIMARAITSEGKELTWIIHSYIMSRTLRILGDNCLEDTYTAKNAPYNGNNQQLGRYVPRISAETNRTRSQMPVISYEFTDGSDFSNQSTENSGTKRKLVQLRCLKQMNYNDYEKLSESEQKSSTVFYTWEEKEDE